MIRIKKINENKRFVVYEYYPEFEKIPGVIEYDKTNGSFDVKEKTGLDKEFDTLKYANKGKQLIITMAKNNKFKEEDFLAWY